jgi:hypothetical protein
MVILRTLLRWWRLLEEQAALDRAKDEGADVIVFF